MRRYSFWKAFKFCFGLLCWIIFCRLLWGWLSAVSTVEWQLAMICVFVAVPLLLGYDRLLGRKHH